MTAPQFATFVAPALDGDTYSPKEHLGRPLIVKVLERKEGVVTQHTPAPGGSGMIVDLVDIGEAKIYRGVLWMGGPAVDGLTPLIGQVTLIKFVDKVGASGRHYAAPESASEYAQNATAYYQQYGDPFAPQFAEMSKPAAAPAVAPMAAPPVAQAPAVAPAPVAQPAPAAAPAAGLPFDPSTLTPEQLAALANLQALGATAPTRA